MGHIAPAISFINSLESSKYQIILIMTNKDKKFHIEEKIKSIDIKYINAFGINRKNLFNIFLKNVKAFKKIKKIVQDFKPNIIIGMGGYISGIGVYVGIKQKVKTMIHEQNKIMGLANKLIYKKVDKVLVSFKLNIKNEIYTGNPRYVDALQYKLSHHQNSNIDNNLLFISGSLGSEKINQFVIDFINSSYSKKYFITVITGEKYYNEVKDKIKKNNVYVIPYTQNIFYHLLNNQIIISRSGSSSIFEILGMKKIPILIPSPNVVNNHQEHNSKLITENKLGEVILEKDLTIDHFISVLNKINQNQNEYITNLNNFILPNSIEIFHHNLKDLEDKNG